MNHEWGIDPTHSRIGFSVQHAMVSEKVRLQLDIAAIRTAPAG